MWKELVLWVPFSKYLQQSDAEGSHHRSVAVGRRENFLYTVPDDEFSAHVLVIADENSIPVLLCGFY